MSSDAPSNGANGEANPRNGRRSSITQAALSNLFGRSGSVSNAPQFPPQSANDPQRRRLSVNTLGLSGSLPNNTPSFGMRRGSMSTNSNSDSIDENAIEDDDAAGARNTPNTPFARRMSMGGSAMRNYRPGGSPGNGNNPTSPPSSSVGRRHSGQNSAQNSAQSRGSSVSAALSATSGRRASSAMPTSSFPQASNAINPRASSDIRADQQGFNWSDHFKNRAESSIAGSRPSASINSLSSSPPRGSVHHDRAKSVSDMPQPPAQASSVKPRQERPKPDAFQERILKGDFYMD